MSAIGQGWPLLIASTLMGAMSVAAATMELVTFSQLMEQLVKVHLRNIQNLLDKHTSAGSYYLPPSLMYRFAHGNYNYVVRSMQCILAITWFILHQENCYTSFLYNNVHRCGCVGEWVCVLIYIIPYSGKFSRGIKFHVFHGWLSTSENKNCEKFL